jgi:hypothetical protein
MFNKVLIAFAILIASPAFVSAQDIFWSFSPSAATNTLDAEVGTSGSAYIFSHGFFGFDAIDLNFTTNTDVIQFTGGEGFNPNFGGPGGTRFNFATVTIDTSGNFFAVSVGQNGVNPASGPFYDPGFDFGVNPPSGSVLLARVDFDVVGEGTADLQFALGSQGAVQLPMTSLNPSFGSATLTANTPPPLIILGDANLDGTVDMLDVSPFIAVLFNHAYLAEADCNQDDVVNFFDITPFIGYLPPN